VSIKTVSDFLKSNPNTYFPSKDIAVMVGVNRQTGVAALKKLEKRGEIKVNVITTGKTNQATKTYGFTTKNEGIESAYKAFRDLVNDDKFFGFNTELKLQLLILAELKKMNKVNR